MMRRFSLKHGGTGRKMLSTLALLAGLAALSAQAANAAVFLRGYMSGVPSSAMTSGDWDAFQSAAQSLLNQMPSTIGQSQDWQGPSGAHGKLTIDKIYERKDLPCRTVSALFNGKSGNGGRSYTLNVCRDAQGDWKLLH